MSSVSHAAPRHLPDTPTSPKRRSPLMFELPTPTERRRVDGPLGLEPPYDTERPDVCPPDALVRSRTLAEACASAVGGETRPAADLVPLGEPLCVNEATAMSTIYAHIDEAERQRSRWSVGWGSIGHCGVMHSVAPSRPSLRRGCLRRICAMSPWGRAIRSASSFRRCPSCLGSWT